eukprot:359586-Chlamydomonas_euryale.AAC.20
MPSPTSARACTSTLAMPSTRARAGTAPAFDMPSRQLGVVAIAQHRSVTPSSTFSGALPLHACMTGSRPACTSAWAPSSPPSATDARADKILI